MTWFTPCLDNGIGEHQWSFEDGDWCAICGRYLRSVDGVVIHDDIKHPADEKADAANHSRSH